MLQKHIDVFFKNLVLSELSKEMDLSNIDTNVEITSSSSLDTYLLVVNMYNKQTNKIENSLKQSLEQSQICCNSFLVLLKKDKSNYNCFSISHPSSTVGDTYYFEYVNHFAFIKIPDCLNILDADININHDTIIVTYLNKFKKNKIYVFQISDEEHIVKVHSIKLTKLNYKELRCRFNNSFVNTPFTIVGFDPNIHIGKYKYDNKNSKFTLVSSKTIEHLFNNNGDIENISLNYFI